MAEYSNRTDLQNPATSTARFTGQTYGQGAAQQASQQAVRPGTPPTEQQAQQLANRIRPGARPLGRPSERPNEPITAGAPFGAGPGPLQAGIRPRFIRTNRTIEQLEALYQAYPRDGILALLQKARMMEEVDRMKSQSQTLRARQQASMNDQSRQNMGNAPMQNRNPSGGQ